MRPRKRAEKPVSRRDLEAALSILKDFAPLRSRCERALRRVLPREDANVLREEVAYEFLLLLWEYDATQGVPLAGYFTRKLPWRVANWLREERRHLDHECAFDIEDDGEKVVLENEWPAGADSADDDAHLDALRLRELLPLLPPQQKQVIGFLLQDFTERDIAARLGISQPRVNQIKNAAFATLRKNWGGEEDAPLSK